MRAARVLPNRAVDVAPAFNRIDVAVHGGEVRAHRHDGDVAPPSFTPRRDVAGPLVVAATVLLNGLKAKCINISAELAQLGFDPRLDLDRLRLRRPDGGGPVNRSYNRELPDVPSSQE